MLVVGREGAVALANSEAERVFGYAAGGLLGRRVEDLIPERYRAAHSEHRDAYAKDARRRPMGVGLELFGRRQDGGEFPAEISLSPVELAGERVTLAAIRDISDRKALTDTLRAQHEQLQQQHRQVEQASRLKSEFMANMSHELRTPLNAIIGFAQLMHDGRVGAVSQQHKEFLGDILTSAAQLLRLINDVLELAKLEAGRIELRPEPLAIQDVADEVVATLRPLWQSKRIEIGVEVSAELEGIVADRDKLRQVLHNYVSNALKFTPEGGSVRVRAVPESAVCFRVEVEDNGIGIGAADMGRLFVDFQQLDAGTAKRYAGTGLGLALTKRSVEAQGGSVGVRPAPLRGSVFYAVLPRVVAATAAREAS
jgi:protein-histidine pros-kinase